MTTWEQLEKNQNDGSTIEEAVAVLIQDHDDDVNAHTEPGQALTGHRAAEIIDHLAESVVNDKLKQNARRYVAIVDPASESDYNTLAEAAEYALSVGGGDIFINRGTHYLSDDVYISPLMGLYGLGINETIIESNDAEVKTIRSFASQGNQDATFAGDVSGANHDIFTVYDIEVFTEPLVPGMIVNTNETLDSLYVEITEIIDEYNFRFSPANSSDTTGAECYMYTGANAVDTSAEVTLLGDETVTNQHIYLGQKIRFSGYSDVYTITEILSATTVLLDRPVTLTTGDYGVTIYFNTDTGVNIEGITFGTDSVAVRFETLDMGAINVINECWFKGIGNKIMASGLSTEVLGIENCIIDCESTDYAVISKNAYAKNVRLNAFSHGSKGIATTASCSGDNIQTTTNSYTGHYWLSHLTGKYKYVACDFLSCEAHGIGTGGSGGSTTAMMFIGCYITMKTNIGLDVLAKYSTFMACRITHTAGYPIEVEVNNEHAQFIGCITSENVLDNASYTHFVGNSANEYWYVGTTETEMDFKTFRHIAIMPSGDRTLTAKVPQSGKAVWLEIIANGTTSRTMTFSTGFKATGNLATGTTSSKVFLLCFISNGTNLYEVSRTAAYTY
jgi:hypothetical protein